MRIFTRSTATAIFIAGVVAILFYHFTSPPPPPPSPTKGSKSAAHDATALFLSLSDNATAARHLAALTRRPHVAGTLANSGVADYILSALSALYLSPHSVSYEALLSYPVRRSLSLAPSPGSSAATAFGLVQEIYPGDPYAAASAEAIPTFHAYAASGSAAGPVVFAGFGRVEDFAALREMGVDLAGSVVLARYGKIFRGNIARNARDAGAAAAVVYTDAADFGGPEGAQPFPEGRWMPPSGVQVGTTNREVGDPTTPGWASSPGCERVDEAALESSGGGGVFPGIPTLPVSARDGAAILRSIGGKVAPDDWQGKDGSYRVGPGPGFLNLQYEGNETLAKIQNVFAVIEGEVEPDRYVLLGNHHDAWTFGAVDPNSGTASMLEVAQRLSEMQKRGWRPRRTIILCSWDAEEYGLIGSTEWVEDNREMLASRAVAYLNVDVAVCGPGFIADATPQLDDLIIEATKQVKDPDNSSRSLYESWISSGNSPQIDRLSGDSSDYAPFLQHVGVAATDMTFGSDYPVYHSLYDDFVWMQKFGDPTFQRHVAVSSVWGLMALRLADAEILPFNYSNYAHEIQKSTENLEADLKTTSVSFAPLYASIESLRKAAASIEKQKQELEGASSPLGKENDPLKVRALNDRLMMAERAFTDADGLPGRQWYKHLVYGPSRHDAYGRSSFPGIVEAVGNAKALSTTESWRLAQHEIWRAARAVKQASLVLGGELS